MSSKRNCVVSSRTVMLKIDDSFFSLADVGGGSPSNPVGHTSTGEQTRGVSTTATILECDSMHRTRHNAPNPLKFIATHGHAETPLQSSKTRTGTVTARLARVASTLHAVPPLSTRQVHASRDKLEQRTSAATCSPVGLVDDEVPPSDLVQGSLLDVGDLVRGQEHVPFALYLR